MTNEQLTQSVIELVAYKAKAEEEHDIFKTMLKTIQEDIKATKSLAEDVHIMALNMQNMRETLDETNKKVDDLSNKEFKEYEENKKLIKQNIITKVVSTLVGAVFGIIGSLIVLYAKGGF